MTQTTARGGGRCTSPPARGVTQTPPGVTYTITVTDAEGKYRSSVDTREPQNTGTIFKGRRGGVPGGVT
eukprot:9136275-Pyramimonas_sp.AAC.2